MVKKVLPILIVCCLLFNLAASFAATNLKGSLETQINAIVGEFYLNISGFVSPFASVVLTSDGIFLRSTVADPSGNFSFPQIMIKRGFSHFCLEAVDFKRIGESFTCINIAPAQGSVTKDNIFLPPTLGVSKTSVSEGEDVFAFGYTMPNALVRLDFGGGRLQTVLADGSGYYVFRLKNLPAGKYELFATAHHKSLDSLSPTKKVELVSLSWWDKFVQWLKKLLSSLSLRPLWLALPLIILIFILILKIWPEKFTSIFSRRHLSLFGEKKEKPHLHHYWWLGY